MNKIKPIIRYENKGWSVYSSIYAKEPTVEYFESPASAMYAYERYCQLSTEAAIKQIKQIEYNSKRFWEIFEYKPIIKPKWWEFWK